MISRHDVLSALFRNGIIGECCYSYESNDEICVSQICSLPEKQYYNFINGVSRIEESLNVREITLRDIWSYALKNGYAEFEPYITEVCNIPVLVINAQTYVSVFDRDRFCTAYTYTGYNERGRAEVSLLDIKRLFESCFITDSKLFQYLFYINALRAICNLGCYATFINNHKALFDTFVKMTADYFKITDFNVTYDSLCDAFYSSLEFSFPSEKVFRIASSEAEDFIRFEKILYNRVNAIIPDDVAPITKTYNIPLIYPYSDVKKYCCAIGKEDINTEDMENFNISVLSDLNVQISIGSFILLLSGVKSSNLYAYTLNPKHMQALNRSDVIEINCVSDFRLF